MGNPLKLDVMLKGTVASMLEKAKGATIKLRVETHSKQPKENDFAFLEQEVTITVLEVRFPPTSETSQ